LVFGGSVHIVGWMIITPKASAGPGGMCVAGLFVRMVLIILGWMIITPKASARKIFNVDV
jgi:hypothetical protein